MADTWDGHAGMQWRRALYGSGLEVLLVFFLFFFLAVLYAFGGQGDLLKDIWRERRGTSRFSGRKTFEFSLEFGIDDALHVLVAAREELRPLGRASRRVVGDGWPPPSLFRSLGSFRRLGMTSVAAAVRPCWTRSAEKWPGWA